MNTKDWPEDVLTVLPLALGGSVVFWVAPSAYVEPAIGFFALALALLCGGISAMQGEPMRARGHSRRRGGPLAWGLPRATVGAVGMLLALVHWTARLLLHVMIRIALRG
jgi:hypothetical protein